MDGILNIYKEAGFTSHDVVAKLRGICGQKKIGHTGTLDPDAVGVLPVCLGKATKVCDLLTDKEKCYEAVVQLGIETDTQDTTGTILTKKNVVATENDIQEVANHYIGQINQIPPMYSALKVNGKKLYELAREGKTVERKPRSIVIHSLEITNMDLTKAQFTMRVQCSKGTYIRTLCHDIGQELGCGAAMAHLIRVQVGEFHLEDSVKLSEVQQWKEEGTIEAHLNPIDSVFMNLTAAVACSSAEKYLYNGNSLLEGQLVLPDGQAPKNDEKYRVYNENNEFIAIYRYSNEEKGYRIVKMFRI